MNNPTSTPAPAFTAVAVPGVDHLRRIVGPLGPCGWCPVGDVAERLGKLNTMYAEAHAKREAMTRRVRGFDFAPTASGGRSASGSPAAGREARDAA